LERGYCCHGCHKARIDYYRQHRAQPGIADAWQDASGFWDAKTGCRLPRALRPTECLEYDCRERVFVIVAAYLPSRRWVRCLRELSATNTTVHKIATTTEQLHRAVDSVYTLYQNIYMVERAQQLQIPERIPTCPSNELSTCSSD